MEIWNGHLLHDQEPLFQDQGRDLIPGNLRHHHQVIAVGMVMGTQRSMADMVMALPLALEDIQVSQASTAIFQIKGRLITIMGQKAPVLLAVRHPDQYQGHSVSNATRHTNAKLTRQRDLSKE